MNSYQKEYKKSFWNYYFRWNTWYATYDEMNFDNYWYSTWISEDAVARWFIDGWKMNEKNTWWEEWRTNNPCDVTKWEYLPTPENWANLMNIWASLNDTNVVSEAIIRNLWTYKWSLSFGNYGDSKKFANDMLLPTAWIINFYPEWRCEEGVDQDCVEWNYDNYNSSLRAARDDLNSIGSYSVDDWNLYWNQNVYNNYASPVRCFMVANPVTVTFDTDWWSSVQSYKVSEWTTITAPTIPTKDWYIFAWWYTEDGTKWNFEQDRVEEDMTLYAKWRFCWEWFTVKSNKCVPDDMDMEWIIEVSDWEDVIYVKDRNEGVTNDNAVMCMKVEAYGSNLMNQCRTEVDAESCMNDKVSDYLDYINELLWTSFNFEQAEQYFQEHCNSFDKRELFWTYYFRWNNNWINLYDEFESGRIEFWEYDNNSGRQPIENMSQLDEKFLEWWKLWDSEWDWWVEWKEQNNPCGWDREYLPTPEDRTRLINIWMNKNGYSFDDHLHLDLPELPQYWSINNVWQYWLHTSAMDSAWWLEFPSSIMEDQFQMDLLLPYVWAILYEHQSCAEDEWSNCDKMYYQDWGGLRLAQDENWYVWDAGAWGVEYDTVEMVIDEWYRYWWNNVASPVRCFVDVPEVLVVTLYSDGNIYRELNVVKWDTLVEPSGPNKSNHMFDWWYTEDGEKYDFDTPFTEDITLYARWTENKSTWWYSGWGGSSSRPSSQWSWPSSSDVKSVDNPKDNTADDKKEEAKPEVKPVNNWGWKATSTGKVDPQQELFDAYKWAYANGLTKYANMADARLEDPLNRQEMAKISTLFATKFVDKSPNTKKRTSCSQYSDLWKVTSDMEEFIIESCELGYMWYRANGVDYLERFRPYTPVSLAEFSIILSRIMWWNRYAISEKQWYQWHLHAVYENNLIDNITKPFENITRKDAYLMLYRLTSYL